MATKLRKFSRSSIIKLLAFLLIIACIITMAQAIQDEDLYINPNLIINTLDTISTDNYLFSSGYYVNLNESFDYLHFLSVDPYYANLLMYDYNQRLNPDYSLVSGQDEPYFGYYAETFDGQVISNLDSSYLELKDGLIETDLSLDGYIYGWQEDQFIYSRYEADGEQLADYQTANYLIYHVQELQDEHIYQKAFIFFSDPLLADLQNHWQLMQANWQQFLIKIAVCLLAGISSLIYLIINTGRKGDDQQVYLGKMALMYSDILFILLALALGLLLAINIDYVNNISYQFYNSGSYDLSNNYYLLLIASGIALTAGLALASFLALIQKIKAKRLIKDSLIAKLIKWGYKYLKMILLWLKKLLINVVNNLKQLINLLFEFNNQTDNPTMRLKKRQANFIIISAILMLIAVLSTLVGLLLLTLLIAIIELVLVYILIKKNQKDFDEIQLGHDSSISEKIKTEQLKVDLITNVSHDLKTPLTSIISYIELLGKEDDLSPAARDYLQILSQKSQRLSTIVSDLLDLSKASSGNMPLNIEKLDLKRLCEQTLADMDDRIQAAPLEFKLKLIAEPLFIEADGKKLYRVLQNLIDNALKYSLAGSRVYIDLWAENNRAKMVIKNTAAYEMNFDAEEIAQRFTRADKSRSSEGSGLGLAIAATFCQNFKGNFDLEIDGDLFKAKLDFPIKS